MSLYLSWQIRWVLVLTSIGLLMLLSAGVLYAQEATEIKTSTPIKHLLYLMQENHSFDNYFGTYPGAEGVPDGVCMPVEPDDPSNTECVRPFYVGDMPITDLGHTINVFYDQVNEGRMNGFVYAHNKRNSNGALAMGFYDERKLAYYWNIANQYVLFDHFFTSSMGGSVWNHNYWVAAQPGSDKDNIPANGYDDSFVTIFDRLEAKGISWKFYVQNYDPNLTFRNQGQGGSQSAQIVWVPLLNIPRFLDNPALSNRIVDLEEYFHDLQANRLPAVAYIVPSGASEHPPGSINAGQAFVKTLIHALMRSDAWDQSAFFWTYDDWGGWYDHVEPPKVDAYGYGFRAPALLVSPYARRGAIDSTVYDFTSPIKFIEENWGLEPLATRDAAANSIVHAFDFSQLPREPAFVSSEPAGKPKKPEPRRAPVYAAYTLAWIFAAVVIAIAFIDPGKKQNTTNDS